MEVCHSFLWNEDIVLYFLEGCLSNTTDVSSHRADRYLVWFITLPRMSIKIKTITYWYNQGKISVWWWNISLSNDHSKIIPDEPPRHTDICRNYILLLCHYLKDEKFDLEKWVKGAAAHLWKMYLRYAERPCYAPLVTILAPVKVHPSSRWWHNHNALWNQ